MTIQDLFGKVVKLLDINPDTSIETFGYESELPIYELTIDSPNGIYKIKTHTLVLATGHSARDTFEVLKSMEVNMHAKAFAVGFRVMHPQNIIDANQYCENYEEYDLPVSSYKVTSNFDRGVYSFCMCPGGYVVNSSSENERLAINGMSYHARDGINANSAIVITVDENTYGSDLFDGMLFQEEIEKKAYEAGNGNIPLQLLGDFKKNIPTTKLGRFVPAIKGEYSFANLRDILSEEMNADFIEAFSSYGNTIKGFNDDDAILCGVESRTSAPLKIYRDTETFMSNIDGIFPCGEGAGYAGGITSAALDGLKVAEKIAARYNK